MPGTIEELKELAARLKTRATKEIEQIAYIREPENRDGWFSTMSDAEIAADEAAAKDLLLVASCLPALIACAEALRAINERKFETFKARNGKQVGIEGDDGEKCWIVHSEEMFAGEQALSALDRSSKEDAP